MPEERLIRRRLEDEDEDLYARLKHAEGELHRLLEYSQAGGHLTFTPHGLSHVRGVERAYDWLLDPADIRSFNSTECYCLLMATLLHDALMVPREAGEEDRSRARHATAPLEYLLTEGDRLGVNKHEAHAIAKIILAHHAEDLREIPERTVLGDATVGLRKLGACLALADICQADSSRAPQIVFDYLSLDGDSARHWRKHLDIGGVTRPSGSDQLLVSAMTFSEEGEQAAEEFVAEVEAQLERSVPFFATELSPIRAVTLESIRLDSPVERELGFKTDMSAILKILIEGVYERSDVFIRELMQNALDATYVQRAMSIRRNVPYAPLVCVTAYLDEDECVAVRVDDNGSGMDFTQIQDMLLLIGGSATDSEGVKRLLGETTHKNLIATFGVGLLSCLKVASRIIVETARSGSTPVRLELTGINDRILSTEAPPQDPGTSILVVLDDEFRNEIDVESSGEHYIAMVNQVDVQYLELPWSERTRDMARDTLLSSAATEGSWFMPIEPGEFGRTDISGDDYQGWIWFPDDEDESGISSSSIGEVVVLNDGIYVTTDPSDEWLPRSLHICDALLNFSAGAIDLPVSRDQVIQNARLDRRRKELASKSQRALATLARMTNDSMAGDSAAFTAAAVFRDASNEERGRLVAELDHYKVKVSGRRPMTLQEVASESAETVYVGYPQGRFVQSLTRFDGKELFHKEDDIVSLQSSWLSQQGKLVISARRSSRSNLDVKEVELISLYLNRAGVETVDLNEDRPIEGKERSRPLPRESRTLVGSSIKLVEFEGLSSKRGWRVGSETWLNLAHPDIALCYEVLTEDPSSREAVLAATVLKLAALDFDGARVDLVRELQSRNDGDSNMLDQDSDPR